MHKPFGAKPLVAFLVFANAIAASPAAAASQTSANKPLPGQGLQTFPTVGTCRTYCARRYEGARASICMYQVYDCNSIGTVKRK
jgi:hypothetical protein